MLFEVYSVETLLLQCGVDVSMDQMAASLLGGTFGVAGQSCPIM